VIGQDTSSVVIDVGGIGFKVTLSTQDLVSLNEKDGEVTVLTSMMVRDDGVALYGFTTEREQRLFERLITVSGIGPKVALSALSVFDADALQQLIASEDVARISTIPGIGKKTAQRIILELRGALDQLEPVAAKGTASPAAATQATEALLGMGFTMAETSLAMKGYEGDANDVAAMVRYGLKRLGAS
jgi:Holliday junction DNA helicase RuvA